MLKPVTSQPVYWLSPVPPACQLCGGDFKKVMYDARTVYGWGNVCDGCFKAHGFGLGVGNGQRYELQTDGKWLKTEG